MHTLRRFATRQVEIPVTTAWYTSDLGEYRGKQELYTRQSPQRLKALREHALIESAVSSNRIEGVEVEPARVRAVLASPQPLFRDRDEEEVRGYRDALAWIHADAASIPVSEETIKRLHALTRGQIWDAGLFKDQDADIIERYADGRERVRFRTVSAAETPGAIARLVSDWRACMEERWVLPPIALAAFNLDFLCIHPFRDGNGRVSRLLWLLQSYHAGYEVGKYISFERLIEQNKGRYYETLEESSQGWHEGRHDPWPYINYVLSILKLAYRELEERVGEVKAPRGSKREQVVMAIARLNERAGAGFRIRELEQACPGVSLDMVRRVLRDEQRAGRIECQGKGPAAVWRGKG
jgi:Fic family protein